MSRNLRDPSREKGIGCQEVFEPQGYTFNKCTKSDKVVFLTGATGGLGHAIAKAFVKAGFTKFTLCDKNAEKLNHLAGDLSKINHNCKFLEEAFDLENENKISDVVAKTAMTFGRLDVLINLAGLFQDDELGNVSIKKFDQLFKVNVRAPFAATAAAVPYLVRTKGNIVNVSSVFSLRSSKGAISYSMTKRALDGLTECSALELAKHQVRVNGVHPGICYAPFFSFKGMDHKDRDEFVNTVSEYNPMGRAADPKEVANVVVFLASDEASFITAAHFPVDGGKQAETIIF